MPSTMQRWYFILTPIVLACGPGDIGESDPEPRLDLGAPEVQPAAHSNDARQLSAPHSVVDGPARTVEPVGELVSGHQGR